MKEFKKKFWPFVLIILFTIPVILPFFKNGFPSTHDGITHVVRFAKFHQALQDGQIIPRWADGIAFGLGSPVLMYNSYLPYLSAELPRLLGASWSSSIEIIFALSVILSAISFYLWSKEVFGSVAGFVGALFYVWAPYRFIDLYVRGAYPENFAFIFPPLVLLSIKKIIIDQKSIWLLVGVLSLSGLILSHNAILMLFLTVFLLYAALLINANRFFQRIPKLLLMAIVSFTITAFYWMPAFFEKGEVNLDKLNNSAPYLSNFVGVNKIIYSRWGWGPLSSDSPMSLQIGVTHELVIIITLIILTLLKKYKLKLNRLDKIQTSHIILFLLFIPILIFLMTDYSLLFWENISLLSFFLYPWRFLALIVLSTSVLASVIVYLLRNNKFFALILVILLLYSNRNFLQLVGSRVENDQFYQTYRDTTDMWGEFLPINANLEVVNNCKQNNCFFEKIVTPKEAMINNLEEKSNRLSFDYQSSENMKATINTYYFSGWKVFLDDIQIQDIDINRLGTMDVNLPSGYHKVVADFQNTPMRNFTAFISLVSVSMLVFKVWKRKFLT